MTIILPPPFDWVDIPGGDVRLENRGGYLTQPTTLTVASFSIARYPITNAQYQVFVDAPDGYQESHWWDYSQEAQEWRNENPQPKKIDFGGDDHPRTHVTWYEAVAFCDWLNWKLDGIGRKVTEGNPFRDRAPLRITLPTEAQWQRAAQGDDGRQYPWGDEWDANRCKNNVEAQSIGPTSIRDYEGKGDSPFGVVDMAGNVWEWCLTSWGTGENTLDGDDVRVLRGGSWFENVISAFRVTTRSSWNPDLTSDLRGFRIVRVG